MRPYTKVTWLPDYKRFGIDKLTDDMFNLFKKRTHDIGVVTSSSIRVRFNKETVPKLSEFPFFINIVANSINSIRNSRVVDGDNLNSIFS